MRTLEDSALENKNFCRCGCGQEIELINCRGQLKRFAKGHNVVNFVKHGPEHPSWKGGRTYDDDGYVLIWTPNHRRHRGNTLYVLEHILVMEKHLGRPLKDNERVHHINEIKTDNRIENLQLLTDSKHKQHHTLKMWEQGKYQILLDKCAKQKEQGYSVVSIAYWKRRWNWLYYGGSIGINQFTKFV